MRLLVMAASLLTASPAFAGGIGLLATGGAHTEPLYYYKNTDDNGNPFKSINDYEQKSLVETLPNLGLGVDLALGDRDDKILGDCRFYWMQDSPQVSPTDAGATVPKDQITAAWRETARNVGIGAIGLQWQIVGNDKIHFNAIGHVGSAFVTVDHSEYLTLDIGPGLTYRATRQVQLFGDVDYMARYRKVLTNSVNAYLGARYMFD